MNKRRKCKRRPPTRNRAPLVVTQTTTNAGQLRNGDKHMNHKQLLNCLLTMTILLCALTQIRAEETQVPEPFQAGENVILQWNRVLRETIRTPGQHPATIFPVRSYAMMHAAM